MHRANMEHDVVYKLTTKLPRAPASAKIQCSYRSNVGTKPAGIMTVLSPPISFNKSIDVI